MLTTEQINTIAKTIAQAIAGAQAEAQEDKYIIFIGKKPRNVKAPYIAINCDGQLSGFTSEDDILGRGTDRIGKFTLEEIAERFPQFNSDYFLVKVEG